MKVEMNQPVVVVAGHQGRQVHRAEVVKIGRVWIEVLPEGWRSGRAFRLRLDTQTDGSQYASGARFYTLDQWAERERQTAADAFLREQGISINSGSPWRGREVELSDLLTEALRKQANA